MIEYLEGYIGRCSHCGQAVHVQWKKSHAHNMVSTAKHLKDFFKHIPDETLVLVRDEGGDLTSNVELKIEDGDVHIIGH